jgi:hypothetical protein
MATATLNWTPVGGAFSLSQNIDYKAIDDVGWILHSNVSAATNSATITGLANNVIYQFRISNVCPATLITAGNVYENTHLTCPTVLITPGITNVTFSFDHLGGDVSAYTVDLLSSSNVVLGTKNVTSPGSTVSDSFTGLTLSTAYKIRVTVKAQGTTLYTLVCTAVDFTTIACSAPTAVSAVMT